MATYFVEINAHYLVKIEIDGSNGAAEHHFLDKYKWVWAANSFDMDTVKTDTFMGTLLHSEMVSEAELAQRMAEIDAADFQRIEAEKTERLLKGQVEALERQLEEKRRLLDDAARKARDCKAAHDILVARSNARRPM